MNGSALQETDTELSLLIIKFRDRQWKNVTSHTFYITYCRNVSW